MSVWFHILNANFSQDMYKLCIISGVENHSSYSY